MKRKPENSFVADIRAAILRARQAGTSDKEIERELKQITNEIAVQNLINAWQMFPSPRFP